jgi:enamine deaminase RidA (YjgF/YER057c/UK114 family)
MKKQVINPAELVAPKGFSHGIATTGGRLLFLAGQDATGPDGRLVGPGDLVAQFEQVLSNLKAVVVAAGGTMQDIVKLNIFLLDRDDYDARRRTLGKVWSEFFGDYYPAMALFEIKSLYEADALVEIEGMAVLEQVSDS